MSAFTATGRGGVATTFVTDYQTLGINPSNLGWKTQNDKIVSIGLLEGAYSIYSEALTKPELRESIKGFGSENKFTYEEKIEAVKSFTNAGFTINVDVTSIAFAVQPNEKTGGFAFGIKDRFQWYSIFNETISEILSMGYNADYFTSLEMINGDTIPKTDSIQQLIESGDTSLINNVVRGLIDPLMSKLFSELLEGTKISMLWYREFNFSYGRKIISNDNYSIYGGIGLKYIRGMAILDIKAENGELEAFSAITPAFGIDYGDEITAQNPSSVSESGGVIPKGIGSGYGLDIGFSAIIKEKFKIGIAINDIGSITWNGNVYVANDDSLIGISSSGFNSDNIFQETEEIIGENGFFKWNGESEKKTKLPTNIRVGASFRPSDKFEAGIDVIIPVNDVAGNYEKALLAFGFDFKPIPLIRLSTGISTGGNYGFNLPVGITFVFGEGTWEAGVASRDVVTFFTNNRPTLSLSAGFLRFRF